MDNIIKLLPDLPQEIKTAYDNNELIVFVGAGVSRLMGCEGWESMANKLIKATCNAATAEQIINSGLRSKEKITIAKRYAEKNGKLDRFWDIFGKCIEVKEKIKQDKNNVYNILKDLQTVFITSNCDGLLVDHYPCKFTVECTVENLLLYGNEPFVFCIHGNWDKGSEKGKKSLVFTAEDYLDKYKLGSDLYNFLRTAFRKTVLFIGYGLSEFEILNVVFDSSKGDSFKHFALEGFFQYQVEYLNAVSEYYSSVGVKLIPYSKDEKGYDQQKDIISNWVNELLKDTTYSVNTIDRNIEALKDFNNESKEEIKRSLDRVDGADKTFLAAILDTLPSCENCFDWIEFLIENDYIKVQDIPLILETKEGKIHPKFSAFDCISNCVDKNKPDKNNLPILLCFIRKCIQFINEKKTISITALCQLAEIIIKLNCEPTSDECWYIIDQYINNVFDGGYNLFVNCFSSILKWEKNSVYHLLTSFYSFDKTKSNKSYWFDKMAHVIEKQCKKYQIKKITSICCRLLTENIQHGDFYNSIADRFHFKNHDYDYDLFMSIEMLFDALNPKSQISVLKTIIKNANERSFPIQLSFYLATKKNLSLIPFFNSNPLDKYNIFVDFYLWLKQITSNQHYCSEKDYEVVSDWIVKTNFGFDYENIDDEYREKLLKKYDTRKYQLMTLIKDHSTQMHVNWEEQGKKELLKLNTPDEDISDFYSVKDMEFVKYFEKDDLHELSGYELIEKAHAAYEKSPWKPMVQLYEIYSDLLINIDIKQIHELIGYAIEHDEKEFDIIIRAISNNVAVINNISPEDLYEIIILFTQRISKQFIYEDHIRMSRELVLLLEKSIGKAFTYKDGFELMHRIYNNDLFIDRYPGVIKADIIINVINTAKSEFFSLVIESAYKCFDNENVTDELKKWFADLFKYEKSEWFYLACAYRIGALMALDKDWTVNYVIPELKIERIASEIGVCICYGTKVIYKELVDYLVGFSGLKGINKYIGDDHNNKIVASNYINYIVAAKYFELINDSQYFDFIKTIPKTWIDDLVHSAISGIKDGDFEKEKQLLSLTYKYLCNIDNNDAIHKSVIHNLCFKNNIDKDCWRIIINALNALSDKNKMWDTIARGIYNTYEPNELIETAIEILKKVDTPENYELDRLFANLAKLKMLNAIEKLARFAVNNHIGNILEIKEYARNPQIVVDKFYGKAY